MDNDQFFHLACHVDSTLKNKIEYGEFIDLERLLPRCRSFKAEEGRLEWVTKDGLTFLAPTQERDLKINGFKKWDEAFRVYASIYCNANPSRAGEIWQYIYVRVSRIHRLPLRPSHSSRPTGHLINMHEPLI